MESASKKFLPQSLYFERGILSGGFNMNFKTIWLLAIIFLSSMTTLGQDDLAGYWMNKGYSLDNMGNYQGAVLAYENVTKIDSNAIHAWNNIGLDLLRLGKFNESIEAFDRALSINSSFSWAWLSPT